MAPIANATANFLLNVNKYKEAEPIRKYTTAKCSFSYISKMSYE